MREETVEEASRGTRLRREGEHREGGGQSGGEGGDAKDRRSLLRAVGGQIRRASGSQPDGRTDRPTDRPTLSHRRRISGGSGGRGRDRSRSVPEADRSDYPL